jgi:hypothetical protein
MSRKSWDLDILQDSSENRRSDLKCAILEACMLKWATHKAHMEGTINVLKIVVEKPQTNRSVGRLKRRWKDNIKLNTRETGSDGLN